MYNDLELSYLLFEETRDCYRFDDPKKNDKELEQILGDKKEALNYLIQFYQKAKKSYNEISEKSVLGQFITNNSEGTTMIYTSSMNN